MGLVAFTKTLAREGAKYGIAVNVIAPMAASAMTETVREPGPLHDESTLCSLTHPRFLFQVMPPEMLKSLKPEFVAPLVGVLCASGPVRLSMNSQTPFL